MKFIRFGALFFSGVNALILPRRHIAPGISMLSDMPNEVIKNVARAGIGKEWTYQTFMDNVNKNNVDLVTIFGDEHGMAVVDRHHLDDSILADNVHIVKLLPQMLTDVVSVLKGNHIPFDIYKMPEMSNGPGFLFPLQIVGGYFLITLALNLFLRNNMTNMNNQPGPGPGMLNRLNPFSSDNELIDVDLIDVTFDDVAGCDEAKFELSEVVDFLRNPLKYEAAGAKIPRGILLEGQPGTGKTLLARAVAGEAGVSFLSASGSEFIEMFVGVGASRVRKLFETAEQNSPCVVFIDEIDAVGRQRGAGVNTGNDEREQTLNQILTNMDGFTATTGIIVLAATNRADILDSALLRPGRFDRKVNVPLPDEDGRKAIFKVHTRNKQLTNDTNVDEIAALTSGFSGADISNLANEAAILSVRSNKTMIDRKSFLDAYEKITIGLPALKNNDDVEVTRLVAHHEIGHAITAKYFEEFFDLRKVTINANKGGAGGYTLFTPRDNYASYATKKFMLANIVVALGGRAAEVELFSGKQKRPTDIAFKHIKNLDITSGASNDLRQADAIARQYITLFGSCDDKMIYNEVSSSQPFLGRELGLGGDRTSEYTKEIIDRKVSELVSDCYNVAYNIIQCNRKAFYDLSARLIETRVLDAGDFQTVELSYCDDY